MPKSENQKQKLVRVIEILMRYTDDDNGITVAEIIEHLSEYGISAERKSIYSDFDTLEALGLPVLRLEGAPARYTLAERIFELAELKLLVDAIQSSRFITHEKSREIIDKLKLFAGERSSLLLNRQVYVEDRVKTENSATLYIVDSIHRAINRGVQISFAYFDYNSDKQKQLRHGGERYLVSPKSLIWSDENYYLVAYDERAGLIKNFRVDKMLRVKLEDSSISIAAERQRLNAADYSRKIFGMYGGSEELVTLEVRERLAGVMIDRFGPSGSFIKTPFGFKTSVRVMLSPTFYSWVMSFGADVRILSPQYVRDDFLKRLSDISRIYNGDTDES